jgi:hypothetical protein
MKHHGSFSGVSLGLLALIYTIAGYGIFAGISLIAFAFRIKSVGGEIGNHHSPRDARKRQTRMSVTLRLLSCIATIVIVSICGTASRADDTDEAQLGAQLFNELKSRGEIVQSSPLYDTLAPIAAGITKVVRRQYAYPIHFYIVHEVQPNAFAAPGGNVYVVDSLFYFVKNTEELAGTLCHETSHLLHHDSLKLMKRNETIRRRAVGATILLGPTIGTALARRGHRPTRHEPLLAGCGRSSRPDGFRHLRSRGIQPMGTRVAIPRFFKRRHRVAAGDLVGSPQQCAPCRAA